MRLNVGCGPHYAEGWTNTDLVATDRIRPDLVVTEADPFPFPAGSVERAYLGHVLEHVPWGEVPGWLDALAVVLAPDAEVAVVGPDTLRALHRWKAGEEDWAKVAGIIEGPGAYLQHLGLDCGPDGYRWAADRHHWNCHEHRVAQILADCGWRDITPLGVGDDGRLDETSIRDAGWPLVDGSPCQFAVTARRPL